MTFFRKHVTVQVLGTLPKDKSEAKGEPSNQIFHCEMLHCIFEFLKQCETDYFVVVPRMLAKLLQHL